MGIKQCQVCNQALSKYKCPSCLVPYCSLVCFKRHKETPCIKPSSTVEETNISTSDPATEVERPLVVDDRNEVLLLQQLDSIVSSDDVRSALKDENLQKLINSIDCSPNPEAELDKAMGDAAFRRFTDKVLSTISPQCKKS